MVPWEDTGDEACKEMLRYTELAAEREQAAALGIWVPVWNFDAGGLLKMSVNTDREKGS